MDVRMVKIDVEEVLNDLWTRFTSDIEESLKCTAASVYTEKFNATYEDGRACKYCLDVLRWCKLIDEAECADMQDIVDARADKLKDNI